MYKYNQPSKYVCEPKLKHNSANIEQFWNL